jgi:hypothetical protein
VEVAVIGREASQDAEDAKDAKDAKDVVRESTS